MKMFRFRIFVKNIKSRSGFTLVESLVAIALFAVMALIVFGILSMCFKQKQLNSKIQRETNAQVQEFAKLGEDLSKGVGNNTLIEPNSVSDTNIDFYDKNGNKAGTIQGQMHIYRDKKTDTGNYNYWIWAPGFETK